jgi:hypothetical protein
LPLGSAVSPSVIVVGSSEQIPNELHAYHLVSASQDGSVVLSRHDGAAYTGTLGELVFYPGTIARMVDSVLEHVTPDLRTRAGAALLERWNREWGVAALGGSCVTCQGEYRGGTTNRPGTPEPVRD